MERLLIASYNRVILWDGESQRVLLRHGRNHGHKHTVFYGITWNEKEIYIAEAGGARHCHFHVFDENLNRVGELPIGRGISDPHQILWWDGKLYITSANQDKVFIWDGGKKCREAFWLKAGEPRQHLNSVWCDGGKFYVVEHRYKEMPKRIRVLNLDFEIIDCIELTREGFAKSRPRGCHNVYVEDGILYLCSPNVIVRHDLASGKSEPIRFSHWAHEARRVTGMARPPGKFIVGLSRVAVREKRGEGDAAVVVMDNDFRTLDVVPLKDAGGVNEIRAIDGPDLAHNQIECPFK